MRRGSRFKSRPRRKSFRRAKPLKSKHKQHPIKKRTHKGCSHDNGDGVCRYYEKMSVKERLLRRKFFLDHGGIEEPNAHYLWTGYYEGLYSL